MDLQEEIDKLIDARDKIAEVYESEATDEVPDNGNLSTMNEAILKINMAIKTLKARQ